MQFEYNTTLPTSEVLHIAADLIERRGWSRGAGWGNGPGSSLCLEGGILAALGYEEGQEVAQDQEGHYHFRQCPAYVAVKEFLGERMEDTEHLWRWNDGQRQAAPVIEVLRAAAEAEYLKERTEAVKQRLDIVPAQRS